MKQMIKWVAGVAVVLAAPVVSAQGSSHQPAASTAVAAVGSVFNPGIPSVSNTPTGGGAPAMPPTTPSPLPATTPPAVRAASGGSPAAVASLTIGLSSSGLSSGTASGLANAVGQLGGAPTFGSATLAAVSFNQVLSTASRADLVTFAMSLRSDIASAAGVSPSRIRIAIVGSLNPGS